MKATAGFQLTELNMEEKLNLFSACIFKNDLGFGHFGLIAAAA